MVRAKVQSLLKPHKDTVDGISELDQRAIELDKARYHRVGKFFR
jgi:hypothetical protein